MTTSKPKSRFIAATVLIAFVAVVCVGVLALSRIDAMRGEVAHGEHRHDAQQRFLQSFSLLAEARSQISLSDEERAELTESDPLETGYIGLALTPTTTTDGSLRAKRDSTNPVWIDRIAGMLHECRERGGEGSTVWIGASGSFPALTIAAVLACEAEGLRPVCISSLTASSHGATIAGFDYLAMERILFDGGVIGSRSVAASVGGEEDLGFGLDPLAVYGLRRRIANEGVALIVKPDAATSATERLRIWREESGEARPLAMINIGGNQANVGPAMEALALQPGLNEEPTVEQSQGAAGALLAEGVPVIHLLNLRAIAAEDAVSHPHTAGFDIGRRALALVGLLLMGWWVWTRLSPPSLTNPSDTEMTQP